MINVYAVPEEKTSPLFANAFAAGCHGRVRTEYVRGHWAGFVSPVNFHEMIQARKDAFDFYHGDHAYFGRHQFYRVTKNAFQHRGLGESDGARFERFGIKVKPWKKNGSNIIVCVQSQGYHDRMGCNDWLERTVKRLRAASDRNIIVREKKSFRPLHADLKNAWCVVTHASNAAVESILAGVPAICTGDCAASVMSRHDPMSIESPIYPEGRFEWASVLADNQWTFAEMAAGDAWRKINETV